MRTRTLLAAFGAAFTLLSAPASATQPATVTPAQVNKDRISVTVEGSGPDVILIPGLASSREVWRDLATRLQHSHRLHLVQVAGFAGAPAVSDSRGEVVAPTAEAIADYIRTQHLKAPVIIGHSLGGEVALMLGARHPDQVARLMVVDALPFYTLLMNPFATRETAEPQAAAFRDSLLASTPEQAEALQRVSIARLVKSEAARPVLLAAATSSDRQTTAQATYELMTTDLRPELDRIQVPVEVVYAYDPVYGIPAANVEATFRNAYANTPHINFTRIDDSFHFVMLDQPEAFATVVTDFLRP